MSSPKRRPSESAAPSVQEAPLRTLLRGLRVIECLESCDSMGFLELHRAAGLSKASLTRVLQTLMAAGWVSKRLADGHYRLSRHAQSKEPWDLAKARIAEIAASHLAKLHRELSWPSDLSICDGEKMVILDSSRAMNAFIVNERVLGLYPRMLWSAVGRAYLAACLPAERRRILHSLQESTHPDDAAVHESRWLERLLARTRRQGYGVRGEDYPSPDQRTPGQLNAIAVPVLAGRRVIACLSLIWIRSMMDERQMVDLHLRRLRATAEGIGEALLREGITRAPWLERA
ncbi:MAG: helix-turn-helix domain-containing protein [Burkholderiaceae bacterium]